MTKSLQADLKSMSDFDPSEPAIIYDRVTRTAITWTGEDAALFRKTAIKLSDGSIAWRGMRFDGWGEVLGG